MPSVDEQASGAGGLNKVTYKFTTTGGVTEPTEMIAPSPTGVNCVAELVQGCRALEFKYDTATTAEGEAESQWGRIQRTLEGNQGRSVEHQRNENGLHDHRGLPVGQQRPPARDMEPADLPRLEGDLRL